MPNYSAVILFGGWFIWLIPFLRMKRAGNGGRSPQKLDRRARWGIVLEGIAYFIASISRSSAHTLSWWRVTLSALFYVAGCLLSWTAVGTLGKQWRIDAGLNEDHELVKSGPYRLIRHPIYASMLCMLLGMGFLLSPLPYLALALIIFIIGTEIRVRVEDSLLFSRFGSQFSNYKRSVLAYVPLVR